MKVRMIDVIQRQTETTRVSGRTAVRRAIEKLAAPMPSRPTAPQRPARPTAPQPGLEGAPGGLEDPQNGLDESAPGMDEQGLPEAGSPDNDNLVNMVKGIAHKYLSDDQLDEIGEAVTQLISYVPDQMRKDLVKDFSKYMESAAILRATLSSFVLLTTPPRNMEQIFQFPEQQQEGMQSGILT